jgi:2-dehydro-3-deoxyglucarate aldolase
MKRINSIKEIREKLKKGGYSIGSWMQIPHSSIAEIIGQSGYDWVAIDMEHGSIDVSQLPDLFRALELGNTLPLVRLSDDSSKGCKAALDAGAGGVIVPMIESASQLEFMANECRWPPAGNRGIGFSRANLFGKHFNSYKLEAQAPLLVAMIESKAGVDEIEEILEVEGLDAILIGPYDLSASMGLPGAFDSPSFQNAMGKIKSACELKGVAAGLHIIHPSTIELFARIDEGYRFLAYSVDSVMLRSVSELNNK